MRTSEERVQELHARMDKRAEMKDRRSFMLKTAVIFAACVAVMIGMAIVIARLPIKTPAASPESVTASIFAEHEALGYVVIAVLAFCLGALATILCFRMKKHMEEKRDDDRNL